MKKHKSKKVLMWFRLLPEDIRIKAFSNTYNENISRWEDAQRQHTSTIADAVCLAFGWAETPEGGEYWLNVYDNCMRFCDNNYDLKLLKYTTNLTCRNIRKFTPILSDNCPYKI